MCTLEIKCDDDVRQHDRVRTCFVLRGESRNFLRSCSYCLALRKPHFLPQQDSAAEAEGIEKMAASAASVMNEDTANAKKDN